MRQNRGRRVTALSMGRGADLCLALETGKADYLSRKQNLLFWGYDKYSNDQIHDKEASKSGLTKQYRRQNLEKQTHE